MSNHLLEVLTREGVLINVSVRYWRAAKKLRPEDLGLAPDRVTDRLISLVVRARGKGGWLEVRPPASTLRRPQGPH